MKIQEILAKEDGKAIHCYKQGAFWVGYEQSALAIHREKGYKPTKKYVKCVGEEVVTAGFPNSIMEQWQAAGAVQEVVTPNIYILKLDNAITDEMLTQWKATLCITPKNVEKVEATGHQDLIDRILQFPLAHKTPIEAFDFIKTLQLEVGH